MKWKIKTNRVFGSLYLIPRFRASRCSAIHTDGLTCSIWGGPGGDGRERVGWN